MLKRKFTLTEPPGGLLPLLVVALELAVFSMGAVTFLVVGHTDPEMMRAGQAHLDLTAGLFLTVILLGSGWFVAEMVHAYFYPHRGKISPRIWCLLGASTGALFVALKIIDLSEKATAGLSIGTSPFWDLFWMLSLFHLFHVILGLGFLLLLLPGLKSRDFDDSEFSVRGAALFWHMCDLAWLAIFLVFYGRGV